MSKNRSSVAIAFLNAASAELDDYFVADGDVILRIPAVAREVGELTVTDDYAELTCTVGRIDHRHFEVFCAQGANVAQREQHVAETTVSWVLSVIGESVRFRIQMGGGKVIAGGSWEAESESAGDLLDAADEWKDYLWTGQILHEKRSRSAP